MNQVYKQAQNGIYGSGGFATDPPSFDDTASAIQTLPDHFKKGYKVLEYNWNL